MPQSKIKIQFFHDVLCAWCYAMSPRLRKLKEEFPEIEIVHRSFALAPTSDRLIEMFGTKAEAKKQILQHWEAANQNDDACRINTELMASRNHDYPYSMEGLKACKAAEMQAGQNGHWNYFDAIQKAHLTDCLNIADYSVLEQCARGIGLDAEKFKADFNSEKIAWAIEDDMYLAQQFAVRAVPTALINNKITISGAQKYDYIKSTIENLLTNNLNN